MERKAIKLGGASLRRSFFVDIQAMRACVKKDHPDCSRQVRGYLADRMVWDKFCMAVPQLSIVGS